jgi:hypothetical protein
MRCRLCRGGSAAPCLDSDSSNSNRLTPPCQHHRCARRVWHAQRFCLSAAAPPQPSPTYRRRLIIRRRARTLLPAQLLPAQLLPAQLVAARSCCSCCQELSVGAACPVRGLPEAGRGRGQGQAGGGPAAGRQGGGCCSSQQIEQREQQLGAARQEARTEAVRAEGLQWRLERAGGEAADGGR